MINLLEDYLQNRTDIILDRVVEKGRCDFVRDISAELPLQAIAEMMGIPVEDRSRVFDWTNAMVGGEDPEFVKSRDDILAAAADLFGYSHQLQMERRSTPSDDIVTTLLSADIDGEALTELEFDMFFLILCVAGNETTRNSITRGMMAFLEFGDQWETFTSDPDRHMETAVEEIVRWASPVMYFRRQALSDYEIGGVKIAAGDKVLMWHVAANRDPRAFEDPWRFDIERTPNDHVGFGGGGPHYCLGASLARMEIRLMFREIARRMPDIRLDGEPDYLRSNFIGGVKRLPVPTPRRRRTTRRRCTVSAPRPASQERSATAATWSAPPPDAARALVQAEAAFTSQSKTGSPSRESINSGCHCTPSHGRWRASMTSMAPSSLRPVTE